MSWTALLVGCAACYLLKVAGLSVPAKVLASPKVQLMAAALPVALLAALIALQTWTSGKSLIVDARTGVLPWRRSPSFSGHLSSRWWHWQHSRRL